MIRAVVVPQQTVSMSPDTVVSPKRVSFNDEPVDLEAVCAKLVQDEDDAEEARELEFVRVETRGRRKPPLLAHALSGMLGSVSAELILFPVDTVKLLIQTERAKDAKGFASTLFSVLRTKGVGGLYKGISASVLKESIHSFNYWLWHGLIFRLFAKADDTSKTPAGMRLFLNLVAKQLNWLCTVPFEVISSVNQLAPDSPGFFATATRLYSSGGIGVFYRGLAVSMALAINPAIMNTLITSLLRFSAAFRALVTGTDYETARDHGPVVIGVATALSKFVATVGTYPLIRAKVLQQTSGTGEYFSVTAIWRQIVLAEGIWGLYRGLLAMSYKTVCWNTLMMMFKHALGPKRPITPPATPPKLDPATLLPPMPWMAREPFPAELITTDKLDVILGYIQRQPAQDRVNKLEGRMKLMSNEMREIKMMLRQVVSALGQPSPVHHDRTPGAARPDV